MKRSRRKLLSVLRRGGWGVADQALSSLSNFVVGIAVARELGTQEFGAFSLAFTTYLLVLNLSRAVASEPLMVRYSAAASDSQRDAGADSTGIAVVLGILAGVGLVPIGIVLGTSVGVALIAMGVVMPGLLLQDAWRFVFFTRGKPKSAFINDLAWTFALVVMLAVLLAANYHTIASLTLAWGVSASIAAGIGIVQSDKTMPRPTAARAWLRLHRSLIPAYVGEMMALSGSRQITFYAVELVGGLTVVAGLRAGQILFGVPFVFMTGLRSVAVPDAVRRASQGHGSLRGFVGVFILLTALATGLSGLAAALLPDSIGHAILGQTWPDAQSIIVPLTLAFIGFAIQLGFVVGLRALAAARQSFQARVSSAAFILIGTTVGAAWSGLAGAAWGFAAGNLVGTFVWAWAFEVTLERSLTAPHDGLLASDIDGVPQYPDT